MAGMTLIRPSEVDRVEGGLRRARGPRALRAAYALSWVVLGAMVSSSLLGLFARGLYREGAWAGQALRGGDLVTLVVAAPLLAYALVRTMRGSMRWPAVWLGMLGYATYDYAFYVFGASFNDAFLLHIVAMSASLYAIPLALSSLDVGAIGEQFRNDGRAHLLGGVLIAVGVLQGAAWLVLIVRNVLTGELLRQVPVTGQHLIFALDLTLMMPALAIAGVLLWRRTRSGYLLGTAVAVLGAVYTLNGNAAAWFQARAGVAGAHAVSPVNVVLTLAMLAPAVALWRGSREARRAGIR
jgi:hypothetical protein